MAEEAEGKIHTQKRQTLALMVPVSNDVESD